MSMSPGPGCHGVIGMGVGGGRESACRGPSSPLSTPLFPPGSRFLAFSRCPGIFSFGGMFCISVSLLFSDTEVIVVPPPQSSLPWPCFSAGTNRSQAA